MVVGEMAHERDIIIIGGGPGGYTAAIRAAQLGASVTLIEKEKLGGVCLNKGCIPSKILTQAANKWKDFQKSEEFGFELTDLTINHEKRMLHKDKVINQLLGGITALLSANKIEVIYGKAFFLADNKIGVEQNDRYEIYQFQKAIVATGSQPSNDTCINFDNKKIIDAWNISSLEEIPFHLAIYGSDTTSLEMATSYRALGAKVTLILDEKDGFTFDTSINKELKRLLKKEKITLLKGFKLIHAEEQTEEISITLRSYGEERSISCSHLFVAGRNTPNTKESGLDRIGVQLSAEGFIITDQQCRTNLQHIFAIGDVTFGPSLAVKAIKQGKVAAENACGLNSEVDLHCLPNVVHTIPPIATVGLTEEQAKKRNSHVITSQFSLAANGYSSITGKKDGFVKMVCDGDNDLILGMHIIGAGAIELISVGTLALEMCARIEDIKFPLYPHPSMNESLLESAEQLLGQSIHTAPIHSREAMKS